MDVVTTCFSFRDPSGSELLGRVFFGKHPGSGMRAYLCRPTAAAPAWQARRSRRDGEGQRQLEMALVAAAARMGCAPLVFSRTGFSLRGSHSPTTPPILDRGQ